MDRHGPVVLKAIFTKKVMCYSGSCRTKIWFGHFGLKLSSVRATHGYVKRCMRAYLTSLSTVHTAKPGLPHQI